MKEGERRGVDTVRIMEQIRARVTERKAKGLYTEGEIAEITRMELHLRENEGYGESMDRILSWLHSHWEATGPVDPEGSAAPSGFRDQVKKALRALLSPAARLFLGKQNQINARIVQLLTGALPPLRDGVRDLEEKTAGLVQGVEKENALLRERLEELSARLDRIEGGEEARRRTRGE